MSETVVLEIELTKAQISALEEICEASGIELNDLINEVITEYLSQQA